MTAATAAVGAALSEQKAAMEQLKSQMGGLARQISNLGSGPGSGSGPSTSSIMDSIQQDPETAAELEQLLRTVRSPDGRQERKSRRSSIAEMIPLANGPLERSLPAQLRKLAFACFRWCDQHTPTCTPTSAPRIVWGLCIPLLRCFVALVAPVHAAFGGQPAMETALIVTDVLFLLDFFVRCRTSFLSHGLLVSDPLLLVRKQLTAALLIDALPLAWIGHTLGCPPGVGFPGVP